jgi:hypothetical protein
MTEPIDFSYPDEWPSAVGCYLLGKQEARLGAVAREALGLSGMPNADWWRLALIMWRQGWRCRIVGGALVWRPSQ